MRLPFRGFLASLLLVIACGAAAEPGYPNHALTLVVAFAPGGGTDTAARLVAKALEAELHQPVVVDDRAGAGGAIGAAAVVRAAPDGYTLLFGSGSEVVVLPAVRKRPPYDPLTDFTPVVQVGTVSFLLVANPALPVRTVADLLALARTRPDALTFASYGVGSTNHLVGELFATRGGVRLLHVPYKGSAAAATDLIGGRVDLAFDTVSTMLPYVRSGRLRALATLSATRSPLAPEIPTMAEGGMPDFVVEGWLGVLAPPGTDAAIVRRLDDAMTKVLQDPSLRDELGRRGVQVTDLGPDRFRASIASDLARWRAVVRRAGIETE